MYLNCHTAYSFKYGTLTVRHLIDEARRCGVRKLVLTEINNTASYIELLRLSAATNASQRNEDRMESGPDALEIAVGVDVRQAEDRRYVLIAIDNDGFEEINRFLSLHSREGKPFPVRAPAFRKVVVVYPYPRTAPEHLCDNEFIGVNKRQLNHFSLDSSRGPCGGKFVILHPVSFASRIGFNVHRLLRAIHHNTLLSKLAPHQHGHPDEQMLPEKELAHDFRDFPELIANTQRLLAACRIDFDPHSDKNVQAASAEGDRDWQLLERKAWEGFQSRYDAAVPELRERFDRELRIIRKKNFCSYYLVAYDVISYAREKGFPHVGRGSGANSMVAYCLGITNVDPVDLDLYFERFLNEERTTPPDFDIDFSWDHRDAIYDYLFQRYGREHVALLGAHVTFQGRNILRELGKVFGLPKEEIDSLVEDPETHRDRDQITRLIFRYFNHLRDLPSGLSVHAGGVLITEKPIYRYTATDLPAKGYPVTHIDMHSAEDIRIFKFDILSQRGLGHIRETVARVRQNRGIDVDIERFSDFTKDQKIQSLMRNGMTMGCFYVESPAMRGLLQKLRCDDYRTLVAASSIIRPGVASSGMMRTYLERFHAVRNGQTYQAVHEKMDELLKETFGVMVYQEDVIRVAHHFAGLSLTEADVLRRGMSGKYRSRDEFQRVKDRFFAGCAVNGYAKAVAERVWFEIESFSGYSFAKGHSASYAVESYQSLYLKAHYPLEFMVSVINNFGGFYKTEFYFREARRSGGRIEAPCVNNSNRLTDIRGDRVYTGFIHLKGFEARLCEAIPRERERGGPFKSLSDFLRRIPIALEQARILIRIGAFRFTGQNKQELLWEAMLCQSAGKRKPSADMLFEPPRDYRLPELTRSGIEDAFDEIELLGFCLGDPFQLLPSSARGDTVATGLPRCAGRQVTIVGYVIVTKDVYARSRQKMQFGTFLDCEGNVFDTIHFPNVVKAHPFRGRGFYEIQGKVSEDFGVPMVEVSRMTKCAIVNKRAEAFMAEG